MKSMQLYASGCKLQVFKRISMSFADCALSKSAFCNAVYAFLSEHVPIHDHATEASCPGIVSSLMSFSNTTHPLSIIAQISGKLK